jgi:hypothetical protein
MRRSSRVRLHLLPALASASLATAPGVAHGQAIYTWTDGSGVVHYTDDPTAMPATATQTQGEEISVMHFERPLPVPAPPPQPPRDCAHQACPDLNDSTVGGGFVGTRSSNAYYDGVRTGGFGSFFFTGS